MYDNRSSLDHRHRFQPEVIAEAVWLYFHFPLSFRMVEDMLAWCCHVNWAAVACLTVWA
ncbi:Mobile element protein [Ochrobactrum soli]|uniref:Mobile element protein n=1 Tax=Ochrobactrum soli TaxID=2448455 RepID=A0A2P9HE87_9HYPH|nr:Mobile element protein [[Ochrobactrum] soli]